jgi:hypothetical protein
MHQVYQTNTTPDRGDCLSACLASLLEIPIESVPAFRAQHTNPDGMMCAVRAWLQRRFHLGLLTIWPKPGQILRTTPNLECMAGGNSGNVEGCMHAVVGKMDAQGGKFILTHDPNPAGGGLNGDPICLYFLVPYATGRYADIHNRSMNIMLR